MTFGNEPQNRNARTIDLHGHGLLLQFAPHANRHSLSRLFADDERTRTADLAVGRQGVGTEDGHRQVGNDVGDA